MSKIKAKIIADSVNPQGDRLTTFVLTFPRFLLSELNTHRAFSRNSASSRAIPFKKMVESVKENPFIPIAWQKDHKGMQGNEYFTTETIQNNPGYFKVVEHSKEQWLKARDRAIEQASILNTVGITKQLCNRLLEPYMWHTVILTSGKEGLENFFELRCPEYTIDNIDSIGNSLVFRSKKDFLSALGNGSDNQKYKDSNYLWGKPVSQLSEVDWLKHNKGQSEIHMMALSEAMWDAYNESSPKKLGAGEWHIPFKNEIDFSKLRNTFTMFGTPGDIADTEEHYALMISAAKAARISYTVVGETKEDDYQKDIELHKKLLESQHLSCFEHCAMAIDEAQPKIFFNGQGDVEEKSWIQNGITHINRETGEVYSNNIKGFVQYRALLDNKN